MPAWLLSAVASSARRAASAAPIAANAPKTAVKLLPVCSGLVATSGAGRSTTARHAMLKKRRRLSVSNYLAAMKVLK